MTQGCQKLNAYLNGIPVWCAGDDGHEPPCFWPDVSGYANANIQVDMKNWDTNQNFRFPVGMPPVLEARR